MIQDVDGNILMDWIGGVGVLNIGFSHPEIIEAVKAQADKYFHGMFNIVTHEGYVALAEKLAQIVPVQGERKKVFFANSGAEADENAVKIAKAYTGRPNIIVFSGAFHGRTMLTMTMTAKKAYTTGMGPLVNGVFRAKFPTIGFDMNQSRVDALMSGHDATLEVDDALLQEAISKYGFVCTTDLEQIRDCNFYVVAVPTPVDRNNHPDLTPLLGASHTVGQVISRGDVVVYESTVYPGVTEEECLPQVVLAVNL